MNILKRIYKKLFDVHQILEYKRAKLLQTNGLMALQNTVDILKEHRIYYWIDSGTLLGILRDGKFIENDTDIDIAIVIEDATNLYQILQNNGYNIWYYYDDKYGNKNLIRAEKYNVGIDFEIFFKNGNKYFYDAPRSLPSLIKTHDNNKKAVLRFEFNSSYIEHLVKYTFKDITFNIPADHNQYFSTYYSNWKVKTKKTNYLDGYFSKSVEKYNHHNESAYYIKNQYLYFHDVSPSTIQINFKDLLSFTISKWKSNDC